MVAKVFKYCFDKWWRPVAFWFFTLVIVAAALYSGSGNFKIIAFVLYAAGSFALLIASVYQLVRRRWLHAVIVGLFFCATCIIGAVLIIAMFLYAMDGHDKWADDLTIPTGIVIEKPIEMQMGQFRPDSVIELKKTQPDFHLYNSFQRGVFEYDLWLGKIAPGTVYLQAYEITQNHKLSAERLRLSSLMTVGNQTDSMKRFESRYTFIIYEGDWGKPYAARFEVWYRPERGGKERRLLSKNYIIEGWQR
jgi:hypothetical protein